MRSITLLDRSGHVTITWTEEHDAAVEDIVRKKMGEGMSFFVVIPQAGGLIPPKKEKLEDVKDASKHRALAIEDADFAALVASTKAEIIPIERDQSHVWRSTDPSEVAKTESIGVKPKKGG